MSEGRAQARSRGRAKLKPPTQPMTSARAAVAATTSAQPVSQQLPPQPDRPQYQTSGRAMVRAPAPAPSRRPPGLEAGGFAPPTSQMASLEVKDEVAQMGRGAYRGRREIQPNIKTRPASIDIKTGTSGKSIKLQANYFKLETHTDWCLYQYRVDFDPDEERTGIRKKLLALHKEKIGGYIFDGNTMWTICLLRPDPVEMFSQRESDGANIKITIKKTVDLSIGDYAYIQLFNIITRKCLEYLELQLVGRDYFNPKAKIAIREYKMELWPGYATSIRQHEDSILMNVEVTHKVMRLETLHEIYNACYHRDHNNYKEIFLNSIIGSTVMTDYNQKTYRIDDVNFEGSPKDTFEMKGVKTSFIEYYQKRYGIRIRATDQPLLISRAKAREVRAGMTDTIVLIPELCRATGLTDEMRADVRLMRALADQTRIPPSGRINKLHQFLARLRETPKVNEEFALWNMKLSNDLVEFDGRLLQPETIILGNNAKYEGDFKADWTGAMRNRKMVLGINLTTWAIVAPSKLKRDATSFAQILTKASSSLQFNIPQPKIEEIPDDRTGSYCEALDRLVSQVNPQLIMCIVPNNKADRYSAIKKKACVDRCVPTQVVLAKNISSQSKGIFSIATKVAIQMNCKLGGAPWTVDIPLNGVMVVGFDTTHDTGNKNKSFGATVCSLNKLLTQYVSFVTAHSSGAELSNQISQQIGSACMIYRKHNNGELPSKIIIYRDGVGEGQLSHVFTHEIETIQKKLTTLYGGQEPKMAVIVVSKRISTRIFFEGDNPPPGTIVDDVITSPDKYDFYLVSQSVRQGTVSPTSYNVIFDTTGLPPDRMQRFTYKLTHLYFNWSGTVRVPAPCQYAHKLALLVGQAIHRPPNEEMKETLYYL